MKLLAAVVFLASLPSVVGQQTGQTGQAGRANFTRLTVAAAPNQAGGAAGATGAGGGQTGGISFVTRPSSHIGPILAGAALFSAAGVPVIQSAAVATSGQAGGGRPLAAAQPTSPPRVSPAAVSTLRALAAAGDSNARQALTALGLNPARATSSSGR